MDGSAVQCSAVLPYSVLLLVIVVVTVAVNS